MSLKLLFVAGLVVEFSALIGIVLVFVRERIVLFRIAASTEAPHPKRRLPSPYQRAAERLVDAPESGERAVDGLSRALVTTTEADFLAVSFSSLFCEILIALAALSPLIAALCSAASTLAELTPTNAHTYARLLRTLPDVFSILRLGFALSTCLLIGSIFLLCVRWSLLRSEASEARFVRALLSRNARLHAPTSPPAVKMARLLCPDPSLASARVAVSTFMILAVAAFTLTRAASSIRQLPVDPPGAALWPEFRTTTPASEGDFLPSFAAGSPVSGKGFATLMVAREGIRLAQAKVATLDAAGTLDAAEWQRVLVQLRDILGAPTAAREVLVLGQRDVPAATVLKLASGLLKGAHVSRLFILLERTLRAGDGTRKVQSALHFMSQTDGRPDVALRVTEENVRVSSGKREIDFSLRSIDWRARLRREAHLVLGLFGDADSVPRVAIAASPGVRYELLLSALSAVDSACETLEECGLPGLGIEFVLSAEP